MTFHRIEEAPRLLLVQRRDARAWCLGGVGQQGDVARYIAPLHGAVEGAHQHAASVLHRARRQLALLPRCPFGFLQRRDRRIDMLRQQDAVTLEVHRLISTAYQVQLVDVVQAGRVLEQRLTTYRRGASGRRDARALIAEALYALQAAVARAAADHEKAVARQDDRVAARDMPSDERPLADLRVLLVEDSGDLAEGFGEGLQLVGCAHVACCGTIAAAQAMLAPGQPSFDIALIDHNLGRERGTTLAAWMRQQPHLAHTQRVSYSATPRERVVGVSAAGDFHRVLELGGLRQLIADLGALRASHH